MKKAFVIFFLSGIFSGVLALSTGDEAVELKSKYYNGKVFKTKFYMVDAKNQKKLKVLVFARLLAEDFLRSEALIENIGSRKGVSLAFAASNEDEIAPFLKMRPLFAYAVLYDRDALKKYMGQNIIYPHAYVINYENKIIWDGELIDLPDMLDKFEQGKYDIEVNRKINRYLAEMQNALRAGSEYQLDRAAREILELEPGNLACLRMRMFSFENTNRLQEAWRFLDEHRRKYPKEKHLYMLQIDMGARYSAFAEQGAQVGRAFVASGLGSAEDKLLLAWMFLNHYQYSSAALDCAEKLLAGMKAETFGNAKMQKAFYHRAAAVLSYKYCKLADAVKQQSAAYAVSGDAEDCKMLDFYKKLQEK